MFRFVAMMPATFVNSRCKDARQSRRLSLAASTMVGSPTLRDWVHRFNEEGPDGLTNRKGAKLSRPAPIRRWTGLSAGGGSTRKARIYSERGISRLLGELGFAHISARPQHPRQDKRIIEAFKKTSPTRSRCI